MSAATDDWPDRMIDQRPEDKARWMTLDVHRYMTQCRAERLAEARAELNVSRRKGARWQRAMDEARERHRQGLGPSVPDLDSREVCRPCARVGPIHQRAGTRWRRLLHWAGWWP